MGLTESKILYIICPREGGVFHRATKHEKAVFRVNEQKKIHNFC